MCVLKLCLCVCKQHSWTEKNINMTWQFIFCSVVTMFLSIVHHAFSSKIKNLVSTFKRVGSFIVECVMYGVFTWIYVKYFLKVKALCK